MWSRLVRKDGSINNEINMCRKPISEAEPLILEVCKNFEPPNNNWSNLFVLQDRDIILGNLFREIDSPEVEYVGPLWRWNHPALLVCFLGILRGRLRGFVCWPVGTAGLVKKLI